VRLFGSGFLLSLSMCLDLGVVNVLIITTAVRRGARAALILGIGSAVGDLVYFALSALGAVTALRWRPARVALWLGGTVILLVLAARSLRDAWRRRPAIDEDAAAGARKSGLGDFATGLAMALASPTAILWFAAVGGSVIASHAGERGAVVPFAAGFFVAGVVWSAVLAAAAARFRGGLAGTLGRVLALASAALFIYFAATVFLRGPNAGQAFRAETTRQSPRPAASPAHSTGKSSPRMAVINPPTSTGFRRAHVGRLGRANRAASSDWQTQTAGVAQSVSSTVKPSSRRSLPRVAPEK
jgi:L-lysine exporter family protein LysE/ArgO